jgi:GDP-D-mannose 3',5'-epimerase
MSTSSDPSTEDFIPRPFELPPGNGLKVCIAGGNGFIGSHLAKRLKANGYYVRVIGRNPNEFMAQSEFCNEFFRGDLRSAQTAVEACKDCVHVYNLAADTGGMGFLQSCESSLVFNNTIISLNMLEAARAVGATHYFFGSSAFVYNKDKSDDPHNPGLVETDAWPANPQGLYGLEKLYAEQMALAFARDFQVEVRIARFHNTYGPYGTWKGGREKVPAAFCRKAITSKREFEMWGDGKQTRSFIYIDDCVEGILRLMFSDCTIPLNLGSAEIMDMIEFAHLTMSFENKQLTIKHVPGPIGHRGRNSNNKLIRELLGWEPTITIRDGLRETYFWIKEQIEKDVQEGRDLSPYRVSQIVQDTARPASPKSGQLSSKLCSISLD